MNKPLESQELDAVLSLRRTRAALKELCNHVSRGDLQVVRERAVSLLTKISDPGMREESVDSVVRSQWRQLFSGRFTMDEKRDIRGRYYRARSLYLELNNCRGGGDFFGDGYLRSDKEIVGLSKELEKAFGKKKPFKDYLDILNDRFDQVVSNLGGDCVGQSFLLHDSDGEAELVKIASITQMGTVELKGKKGTYLFEQLQVCRNK